jgi:RHS repeat-associated protein
MPGRIEILGKRAGRRRLTALLAVAAAVPLLTGMQVSQPGGQSARPRAPRAPRQVPVPVHVVRPQPRPRERQPKLWHPRPLIWPEPGSVTVTIPPAVRTPGLARRQNLALAASGPRAVTAGALAIRLSQLETGQPASTRAAAPLRVRVVMAPRQAAKAANVPVLFSLAVTGRTAGPARLHVSLSYSGFASADGGDFASRLHLVTMPGCVLTTPEKPACQRRTPLITGNNVQAEQVGADVSLPAGRVIELAAAPSTSGSGGNYSATPLSEAGQWSEGGSSGAFTYSYPISVPPVPGGLEPPISLDYDSQAVDGLTSATNNQASWIGDGWDYEPGFIEREYLPCAQDSAVPSADKKGDFCWSASSDATLLNLDGATTPLVDDPSSGWHAEADNGAEISYQASTATGCDQPNDYWIVTEPDGVSYYFGLNQLPGYATGDKATGSVWTVPVYNPTSGDGDPCYSSTFASSVSSLAWRWNLDYVTDARSDAMAYFYNPGGVNYYAPLGGTTATAMYDRGGAPRQVIYGFRNSSDVYDSSTGMPDGAAEVNFATATDRTDIPTSGATGDLSCTSGEANCDVNSPSFWIKYRLTGITTEATNSSGMTPADTWALAQDYFSTGDTSNLSPLWLESITRTGEDGGSFPLPSLQFSAQALPNRALNPSNNEGYSVIERDRLNQITTETGAQIDITYQDPSGGCVSGNLPTPDSNTTTCYPVYWAGQSGAPSWFNKYAVQSVSEHDETGNGPAVQTNYTYAGAAWRYDDDALSRSTTRTWDEWRGFRTVTTNTGTSPDPVTQTVDTYFQGMNGNYQGAGNANEQASLTSSAATGSVNVTDSNQFAGMLFEHVVDNGPAVVTDTVTTPWSLQTADQAQSGGLPDLLAFVTGQAETQKFTALASGGYRESDVTYGHDSRGRVVTEASAPDASGSDGSGGGASEDTCTQTTYPAIGTAYLLELPAEVVTSSLTPSACTTTASPTQTQLISDVKYFYDTHTGLTTAPVRGDLTQTEEATSFSGSTPVYTTENKSSFDQYGRITSSTDADSLAGDFGTSDPATTTSYTPATGDEPTSITVTDPMGLATTTTYDPLREVPLTVTKPGGYVTTEAYNAVGWLASVWTPGHSTSGTPEYAYAYSISDSAPSVVTTETLEPDGAQLPSEELYDSLGRIRETQTETASGDRDVSDTVYDSDGWPVLVSSPYWTTGAPGPSLVAAASDKVPDQTQYVYDGVGRVTKTITNSLAVEQYETDNAYGGNYVTTGYAGGQIPVGGTARTTYTDGLGQTTFIYKYHSAGLPGTTAGLGSGSKTSPEAWDQTAYAYNIAGSLHTIKDDAGNTWTYGYDLAGDQTSAATPDTGTTTSAYDADGFLTSVTTPDASVSYSYDADGRKIAEWNGTTPGTPGTPSASQLAMWGYSATTGLPTESVSYVGGSGGQAYTEQILGYNGYGLPTGTETIIPGGPLAGTYGTEDFYTSSGQLSYYIDASGGGLPTETVNFSYDNAGNPTSMTGTWAYVDSLSYTELGQPDQFQMGSSSEPAWLTDNYTALKQLSSAAVATGTSAGTVDTQSYTYDSAGDVLAEDDTPATGQPQDQCFSYNTLGQLTQAWSQGTAACGTPSAAAEAGAAASYWEQYDYDNQNNLTSEVSTPPSGSATTYTNGFPPAGGTQPHTVTSQAVAVGTGSPSTTDYAYSPGGELTTITPPHPGVASNLTWNSSGNLTAITPAGSQTPTASYVYDADGDLLLENTSSGGAILFLPDEQITYTPAGGGNPATTTGTRYYTLDGITLAARTSSGQVQYLFGDLQGTASLAVDSGDLDLTRRYYDPYGNPVGAAPASWPGNRGFVGGTPDPATGLDILGARQYNPATGTFITTDPILTPYNPADLNPYAYASGNPATNSDPTGLSQGGSEPNPCGSDAPASCEADNGGQSWNGGTGAGDNTGNYYGTTSTGSIATSEADAGSQVLPPKIRQAFLKFVAEQPSTYWGGGAAGILSQLWSFCGSNASLCGSALTSRIFTAETGIVTAGDESLSELPPAVKLDLLSCGGMSFTAGTRVLTANGKTLAISSLRKGEKILAFSLGSKTTERVRLAQVLVHFDINRYDLIVRVGGQRALIATTADHAFWDATTHRWTAASLLGVGNHLQSASGAHVIVTGGYAARSRSGWMWDLTIPGDHDFYVAAGGTAVLVHNAPGPGCAIISSEDAPTIISKTIAPRLGPSRQWRVDIENPNPGSGDAAMHFQMGGAGSTKYYYNWETNEWVTEDGDVLAPRIAAQIPDSVVGKALQYFGLDLPDAMSGGPIDDEVP